ncbi:MAG: tetratricopeptide repeat protein, partial [Planctomyces sp.]
EVKRQFEILLDRITPFYQDRMRELGPQESALLETMAAMRDQDKTPSSIAAQMRMPPAQVSSLLKRLSKAQYLISGVHPADGRARLYAIREGFFDIWLAMNISRGVRRRMPFLIEFFAEFYPTIQARNRKREEYRQRLAAERASEKIKLAALHSDDSSKAREYLRETRSIPLEGMGQWIISRTPDEPDYDYLKDMEEMISCWDTWRSGNLEAFAARMKATGASLSWHSWSETKILFLQDHLSLLPPGRERIEIRLQLGNLLKTLARWQDAETQLRAAVLEATELADSELVVTSQNSLGDLLTTTNHFVEAESVLRQSEFIARQTFGPDHPEVARCLNNLANLLRDTNRPSEAEPLYRRLL